MGANLAARRFAKSIRRKSVLADRRKSEAKSNSLAAQVALAASMPLRECLLGESLATSGVGTLILVRGESQYRVAVGGFLVDSFALGVKDVFFNWFDRDDFVQMMDRMEMVTNMLDVDPADGRKLLRDVTAWAKSGGYRPHDDFATVERLFGDVDASTSDMTFEFGDNGTPIYIPGPSESGAQIRERRKIARRAGGDYMVPV